MKTPHFKITHSLNLLAVGILLLLSQGCGQKTSTPSPIPASSSENLQLPANTLAPSPATNPPPATPSATIPLRTATASQLAAAIPLAAATPTDFPLHPQFLSRLNLGWIENIALSPQGDWLVVASASHICLFDTTQFEQAWCKPTELPAPYDSGRKSGNSPSRIVSSLAFHPGGDQLVYALWSGYIVFLDRSTGGRLNVMDVYFLNSIYHLAWSPDGGRMVIHTAEHGIDFWEVSAGKQAGHLNLAPDEIAGVAWSPDSHILAVGMNDEGKVTLWDTTTLEQTGSLEMAALGSAYDLAWSPDGKYLYANIGAVFSDCNGQCTKSVGWLKAWDIAAAKLVFEIDVGEDVISGLSVSANGKWLAASGGYWSLKVFDTLTGKEAARQTRTNSRLGMAWLDEYRLVYPADTGEWGSLAVLDVRTGEPSAVILPGFEDISSFAWLPDSQRLVTDSAGGTISIWQARTGQRLEQYRFTLGKDFLRYFNPASINPADGRLATSAEGSILILDVETRQVLQTLEYPANDPDTHIGISSWSENGQILAGQVYGKGYTDIAVWNAYTSDLLLTIRIETPQHITALALSPDGSRLALGGFSGSQYTLIVWDVAKDKELASIEITCALFREFRWLSNYRVAFATTSGVEIWDIVAAKQVRLIPSGALRGFSPDGSLFVSSHGLGGVTVRDFKSGRALADLDAESVYISEAAFSPDGKLLAVLTDKGSVIIWDMSEFYPGK
jgi:WD40 repeat protein